MAKAPKFEGTITYVRKPIDGVTLYSGGKGEESIDEMLERLNKQDLDDIKREELTNRIKVRAAEANKKRLEVEGKGETKEERRFTIIDNKPVPDPEGEYTFAQALKTCAISAGEKVGVGGDKVSEILGAIAPFVIRQEGAAKEAEEKKVERSIAVAAIDALKERGNVQSQQPLTMTDLITVLDKLNEMKSAQSGGSVVPRSMVEEFAQFGSAVKVFQEIFGGGGGKSEGQAPVYVTIPGSDGKGGMPMDTFMKWDEHRWERHKDEQKFQDSRENAKVARDFIGKLGKAASKLAPKEE